MKGTLVWETEDFYLVSAEPPHVSRTDGGHLVIHPKEEVVHRWEFEPKRAVALMGLSMLAGEAMLRGLNERGIPVERLNFQDNGNWGIGTEKGPRFHLHLYGRARGSVNQVHGEALLFPPKATGFWKNYEPLKAEDVEAIRRHMKRLEEEPRYQARSWTLE